MPPPHVPDARPPGLRFSFSSLGCSDLDPAGLRTLAARHRIRFIKLRDLGGSMDLPAQLAT